MSRFTLALALAAMAAAAALFAAFPDIDLAAAQYFYVGQNQFAAQGPLGNLYRAVFAAVPFLILGVFLVAYAARRMGKFWRFAPTGAQTAFVVLTMALGPGLLVNLTLKDHTHRPRPAHLQRFGGTMEFRPFYAIDGACPANCAFPSGEASASFWLVAPALLAPPPWRAPAVGAAFLFGAATGLLRMAFGKHFLSDVVFAALLTLVLIGVCWRGFFGWRALRPLSASASRTGSPPAGG